MEQLPPPYGGQMVDLIVPVEKAEALKKEAFSLPSIELDWRQAGELEMLMSGAFAPLKGYMGQADYESVLQSLALTDGTFWPLPLTLRLSEKQSAGLKAGDRVALRDHEGFMLAVMTITDLWPENPDHERHLLEQSPLPEAVFGGAGSRHAGGALEGVSLPKHYDFLSLRVAPAALRSQFAQRGWRKVVAYLSHQPMHRAQFELCLRSAIGNEANLLLLPFGGGDLSSHMGYFALMRAYQAIMPRFPSATTQLAMLPMTALPCSPREKLLRAIIARNYGCSHVILGGEHESTGSARRGTDMGDTAKGFSISAEAASRIGVTVIPFPRLQYMEARDEYLPETELPEEDKGVILSGEEFQSRLRSGLRIPDWYTFPEVLKEITRNSPPRDRQGFTVFFTGLSGAGKSTLARALAIRLMEMGGRPVTLLDGDIVRQHLSSELGFSREHRDINVRRIGFVASEITKNRGVAICAPIAPYRQTRRDVRAMIEAVGGFVEVHVSTPIETCEARDRKGLYAKARAGLIPEFTGVSDPYEVPEKPEVSLDTTSMSVDEAIQSILLRLEHEGFLR